MSLFTWLAGLRRAALTCSEPEPLTPEPDTFVLDTPGAPWCPPDWPVHPCALSWANRTDGLVGVHAVSLTSGQTDDPELTPFHDHVLDAAQRWLDGLPSTHALLVVQTDLDGVVWCIDVASLNLPAPCPHAAVEQLWPLAAIYLEHPTFDPVSAGPLATWRTTHVLAVLAPPGVRPQLHLFTPADLPEAVQPPGHAAVAAAVH
ncbi:hypothetical protein K7W42_12940 [Deinococcus sp. HMF7604]|uniref:hypothetical protein n=1 Tax=Deinococcus betulae TaxID=2873312 RepID=UPI001CCF59B1|nr:hypothetical protein [Deinococcus betulae]MBZ9751763.1 hypothetical protein [Deinococcus betulae]